MQAQTCDSVTYTILLHQMITLREKLHTSAAQLVDMKPGDNRHLYGDNRQWDGQQTHPLWRKTLLKHKILHVHNSYISS